MPHGPASPVYANRPALPLANHAILRTTDLSEAREGVARVFCPHRLDVARPAQHLDARHHVAELGMIAVNYVQYGADVEIDPGRLESFYLLQMPLRGRAQVECGGRTVYSTPQTASLLSPTVPTRMLWDADCAKMMLRIDRAAVERHAEAWLGAPLRHALEFDPAVALDTGAGQSLVHLTSLLQAECERPEGLLSAAPTVLGHLEQAVLDLLVRGLVHNQRPGGVAQAAAPRHVRLAEAYMEAHASDPVTLADLVSVTGVSARTLQEGFVRFRETTPMRFLREVRLEGARRALSGGRGPVTDVALAWGFPHLGRFAGDYRRRFGESPSATLKRAQGE